MAMSSAHQNFVSDEGRLAKKFLDEYGDMVQQNVLWAGTPSYSTLITQEEIDSIPSFAGAGLTKQELADACYALEQMRTIMTNAMTALTVMSKLP